MENMAFEKAQSWAQNPYFDIESRQEIQKLLDDKQEKEIIERFYSDLEFGTGGLRGLIGMGSNRINKYTIRKAIWALSHVLHQIHPGGPIKVAVCYDSRKFSKEFAQEACHVLAANQIQALFFDRLNPVPLLSFAVRHYKAQAGIMITASHNPVDYNGCKVYGPDGCQVIPPLDRKIIEAYNSLTDFKAIKFISFEQGQSENLIKIIGKEVEDAYHQAILSKSFHQDLCQKRGRELKIVYTPLHGTGTVPCTRALEDLGLTNYLVVPEQKLPDPQFSTLKTPPNPEIPEALEKAVALLKKEQADLCMGTDPDTDRLGVVVRHKEDIHYLNGNQLAVLLLHYVLLQRRNTGNLSSDSLVVKTIVTTELLTTLAKHFNVAIENTLTGFKWMCGLLSEWERQKRPFDFVFASEESYGYLTHEYVRDKDGVAALATVSEMALWYKTQNLTLVEALDRIYEEFGFSLETLLSLNYEGKEGAEKIQRIMDTFRHSSLKQLAGEKIVTIEDYLHQEKRSLLTKETFPLILPKSNVIGLTMESGNKVFLRPSGTEPKIKFYIMIQEKEGSLEQKKASALSKAQKLEQFLRAQAEGA